MQRMRHLKFRVFTNTLPKNKVIRMRRVILVTLIAVLLVAVQLPYVWLLWLQPKPTPPKPEQLIYLKPNLQKSANMDWFNHDPVRLRWFWFDNSSNQPSQTVLKSGDNLTLWLRISEFNRTDFNITEIRNIQLWFFNIWSPNSTQWGTLWKINIYLQGQFDRSQMLGVPTDGSGTQVILNWDDGQISKAIGEVLRFDFHFESIVPVDAMLVIASIEIMVIAQ
jgi:hypothetical protein